ncbi:MAG: dihydrodipicolinate synthase family protein [Rhizomicrobium sp.]|jgi:4-hydroxy-tetrahydrodipicolinate synthase
MSPFAHTVAAMATPFTAGLAVDHRQLVVHAHWLLENGCDGLLLFGTTGEAVSLSIAERKETLEHLVAGGIPAERLLVGTGCCAVADAVDLTLHASGNGVAGVLVLPPFFYKGVSDAGIIRYYDRIVAECGERLRSLYLYNIPQVAGAGASPHVVDELVARHGRKIRGYKDSSGDWNNTAAILKAHPALEMFVGSESLLMENLGAGGAGCISAGVNIQPAQVRNVIHTWRNDGGAGSSAKANAIRNALEKTGPLIPAVKAALAAIHAHDDWAITRPPLESLPRDAAERLLSELRALGLAGI